MKLLKQIEELDEIYQAKMDEFTFGWNYIFDPHVASSLQWVSQIRLSQNFENKK